MAFIGAHLDSVTARAYLLRWCVALSNTANMIQLSTQTSVKNCLQLLGHVATSRSRKTLNVLPSGVAQECLVTKQTQFKYASFHTHLHKTVHQLLERPSQRVCRSPICTSFPNDHHNDRCLHARVGRASGCSHGPRQMDVTRDHAMHQPPGTQSGQIRLSPVSTTNQGQVHKGRDGQHMYVLY